MRKLSIMALLGALLLAGCGGDSSSIYNEGKGGTTGTGTTTSSDPVAAITVSSSTATIAADGSTSATITATAKDANSVLVAGATVTFSTTAGDLTVASATTAADGTATATLSAGAAAAGTAITVTATSGAISGKVAVTVTNTQQIVNVITSTPSIPSDGSKSATITALVRNAENQFVAGVAVTFTASSGGLAVTQGTTDVNGAATATLDAAGDPSNRTIIVTATAGGAAPATVPVTVTGTSLTVTGPSNLVEGSQGTFTVSLTEAGGSTGISNQAIALTSAKGNTLSAATVTTLATGQATFTVTAVNGGTDTITASALNLKATQQVVVSTQNFAFSAPTPTANAQAGLGTNSTLTVTWTNNGAPATGQSVAFSATRGTLSAANATVDNNGNATVTITSTTAGPSVITATGTGVTAQTSIEFIATNPASIAIQASPDTIAAQGQSTLTATVRDVNDNLVEGQVVNFSIVKDATGGSLSVASAVTNVQGQASTVYTASTTTSAAGGVVISGSVPGTAVTASTSLTVGGQTVFLSLGTGNTISPYPAGATVTTQYEFPYSVQAIDAAGNGVNNVSITFTVSSLGYFKGSESWNGTSYLPPNYSTSRTDADAYTALGEPGCLSEDLAGNGIYTAAEDYNGNGKLDPGLVVSTDVGSAVTANGGTANVNLIYPKDHAYWVAVELTATATVSGTQNTASTSFILPGLAADFDTQTVAPPGEISPYGMANTCKNPN
jgi:hypothetical protein